MASRANVSSIDKSEIIPSLDPLEIDDFGTAVLQTYHCKVGSLPGSGSRVLDQQDYARTNEPWERLLERNAHCAQVNADGCRT